MAIDKDFLQELGALKRRIVWRKDYESLKRSEGGISKEINVFHREESLLKELLEKLKVIEVDIRKFLVDVKEVSLVVYNKILIEVEKLHQRLSLELNKPVKEITEGRLTEEHREVISRVIQNRLIELDHKKAELQEDKRNLLEKIGRLEKDYQDLETNEKKVLLAKQVEHIGVSISEATQPLHRGHIPQWVFMVSLTGIVLFAIFGSWFIVLNATLGWSISLEKIFEIGYKGGLWIIVSGIVISLILFLKRILHPKRLEVPRSIIKFQPIAIVILLFITFFLYQNLSETSKLMNSYNASYHSTDDELVKVRNIVVDKDSEISQKEQMILFLEKNLSATKQSLSESKDSIQVLNDELSKQRTSLTNLQVDLARREEELKQAQNEVTLSQEQLKEKEVKIEETEQSILGLSQELGAVENRILSLESWVKRNAHVPDDILSPLRSNYGMPSHSVPNSTICYIDTCRIGRVMGGQFAWTDDLVTSGSYDHLFDVRSFWNSKKGDCDDFAFFGSAWMRSEVNYLSKVPGCDTIYAVFGNPDENGECSLSQAEKTVEIVNENQIYMVCGIVSSTGGGHCEVGVLEPGVSEIDPKLVHIFEPQAGTYKGTQQQEFSLVWSLFSANDYIAERTYTDNQGETRFGHTFIINSTKERIGEMKNTLKTLI